MNMLQPNSDRVILHLSFIPDVGPGVIATMLERKPASFDFAELYACSVQDLMQIFGLSLITAQKMVNGLKDVRAFNREQELIEKHQIAWISLLDAHYPKLLRAIHAPPPILYYKGIIPSTEKMIGIVGSRKADAYGDRVIEHLVPSLVAKSWVVVSGGALGADAMAHKATLACGGSTIAVLGSGLLRPAPTQNQKLFEAIEHVGAVISIFPLEEEPYPTNFPTRNRVISGLSRGVIVVQATEKSGARITANFALEQGREVFAVPGIFDDPLSAGCHGLIHEGAKLVSHVNDVLQELGETELPQPHKDPAREQMIIPAVQEILDDSADPKTKIMKLCKQACSVDEFIVATGLSLSEINELLFDLQLNGIIEQEFTGKWKRV